MTPTPRQEAKTQTANKVRIFLYVRPRRLLGAMSLVLLAFAGTAAALPGLPAIPGAPAMPALPALPETPELPGVDQKIDTPIGSTSLYAKDGQVDVCTANAASTDMIPEVPALPALPVPAEVPALPALPVDTDAGAALDGCVHANANDLTASANMGAAAYAAGQQASAKAGIEASQSGAGADVEAHTAYVSGVVHWFTGLF